jgi:hypothetical protein
MFGVPTPAPPPPPPPPPPPRDHPTPKPTPKPISPAARLTLPLLASCTPARIDSSVVLPAPLGPITASSSPAWAVKLTSRSASRAP